MSEGARDEEEFDHLLNRLVALQRLTGSIRSAPSPLNALRAASLSAVVDQRRDLLERALSANEAEARDLALTRARIANNSQTVSRFPNEVLLAIFTFARFENDVSPRTLQSVSHRFFDLVRHPSAAVLWSTVTVDVSRSALISGATCALLDAIQRSRTQPLFVSVKGNDHRYPDLEPIIQAIRSTGPRIREFSIHGGLVNWLPLDDMPSLRKLYVAADGELLPDAIFSPTATMPSISSITLETRTETHPTTVAEVLHNIAEHSSITHLDMSISVDWITTLWALGGFPQLKSLRWCYAADARGALVPRVIPLPNLRKLVISTTGAIVAMVKALRAPDVRVLELDSVSWPGSVFDPRELESPRRSSLTCFPDLIVLKVSNSTWSAPGMAEFIFTHLKLRKVILSLGTSNFPAFLRDIAARLNRRFRETDTDTHDILPLRHLQRIEIFDVLHPAYRKGTEEEPGADSDTVAVEESLAMLLVCLGALPPHLRPIFALGIPSTICVRSPLIAELVRQSDRLFLSGDGGYDQSLVDE